MAENFCSKRWGGWVWIHSLKRQTLEKKCVECYVPCVCTNSPGTIVAIGTVIVTWSLDGWVSMSSVWKESPWYEKSGIEETFALAKLLSMWSVPFLVFLYYNGRTGIFRNRGTLSMPCKWRDILSDGWSLN